MSDKIINLTLVFGEVQYQVRTINDTTEFHPGQWLDKDVVTEICKRPNWRVQMATDDTWKQILGFAVSHVSIPTIPLP